ncbi:MAG: hypothetical protein VW338_00140 [Rhodospirillaceae bacterium]
MQRTPALEGLSGRSIIRTYRHITQEHRLPKLSGAQYTFVVCLTRGMGPLKSFQTAYPKQATSRPLSAQAHAASILCQSDAILAWVDHMARNEVTAAVRTQAEHIAQLELVKAAALDLDEVETARKAEVDIGKVSGLYIDRSVQETHVTISPHSLEHALVARDPDLAQRLTRLRAALADGGASDPKLIEGIARDVMVTEKPQDVVPEGHKRSRKRDNR